MKAREVSRRAKIEQDILSKMLELKEPDQMVFSPEALKNMSKRPVSLHVVKEIILASDNLENIDATTGTTRVNGKVLEMKYKLTQNSNMRFSTVQIGGANAQFTNVEKTLKNVIMQNNGSIRVHIEAKTGRGTWTLTASSITQKLPDGTKIQRKFKKDPIHVVKDSTRTHNLPHATKIVS